MNHPRFLFFDLGNVLVDFDHDLMCRQLAHIGDLTMADVRDWIFGDDGLLRPIEMGSLDETEFHSHYCERFGVRVSRQSFLHAVSAIFALKVDMVPLVTQLVSAGQSLGILSNTCQPHWSYVSDGRYAMIPALFDVIVLSFQVHAMKPDHEIYTTAARMAGCDPAEVFYVDDRAENVVAAQEVGFTAVQFRGPRPLIGDLRDAGFHFNL